MDEKSLDRIRKLLALANDGGATEAEASLALEKANELMAKMNISISQLDGIEMEKATEANDLMTDIPLESDWQWKIVYAMEHWLSFKAYSVNNSQLCIICAKSDRETIEYMVKYLYRSVNEITKAEAFKSMDISALFGGGTATTGQYMQAFRLGLVDRLAERISELQNKSEADLLRDSKALVVVNQKRKNIDDLTRLHKFGRASLTKSHVGYGLRQGRSAGDSINLGGASGRLPGAQRKIGM